jgi:transporter family protein
MLQWYYFALAASVLMAISTIIEKKTLQKEHASAYSASFAFIAFLVSLALVPFANFSISYTNIAIIFVISTLSTASYLLIARVFKHGSISVSSSIFSSLPVLFTVMLAFIFLGERLSYINYAGITIIIIATYLLLFVRGAKLNEQFEGKKYVSYMAIISFINAVAAVLSRYILFGGVNTIAFVILYQAIGFFEMFAYMQLRYGGFREIMRNFRDNFASITSIGILTSAYRVLYYIAVSLAVISLVSPMLNTIYVVVMVLSGGIWFNEKDIKRKLVLSLVLLMSAYMLTN